MKSRLPAASRQQNNPQKQTPVRKGAGNGEQAGNGHAPGNGNGHRRASSRAKVNTSDGQQEREVLTDQPDITAILARGGDGVATIDSVRARNVKELDKTTLLTALLAFRKGDFS